MPIYVPGLRKGSKVKNFKRNVVAVLQLTAMVDMFTVLVVFLLQNYAATDQILPISDKIDLPKAQEVKTLKPSYVVILSDGVVTLNEDVLGNLNDETSDQDWLYPPLKAKMEELLNSANQKENNFLLAQLKQIAENTNDDGVIVQAPFRVTIQADQNVNFLDIKKIMYTLTDAGVREMNFAVIKNQKEEF
ncbi:MAG: biopolymer transporter ExbD [Bdellovibrionales bacterium]|nr:biopolymer transporter ExbD [Bdellovibrionales bacterium]